MIKDSISSKSGKYNKEAHFLEQKPFPIYSRKVKKFRIITEAKIMNKYNWKSFYRNKSTNNLKDKRLCGNKNLDNQDSMKVTNTKFFHTSTIMRRTNQILMRKTNDGMTIWDREAIGKTSLELCTKLFSSPNPILTPEIEDLFPSIISTEQKTLFATTLLSLSHY